MTKHLIRFLPWSLQVRYWTDRMHKREFNKRSRASKLGHSRRKR